MPSKTLRIFVSVMAAAEIMLVSLLLAYVNGHRIIKLDTLIPPTVIGSYDGVRLAYPSYALSAEDSEEKAVHSAVKGYITDNYAELLTLVNPWNELEKGYVPELCEVEDGYRVDVRCADALKKMLEDCREAGNPAVLCSAYRTQMYQQELFDNKVRRLIAEGVKREDAKAEAAKSVAPPGTSEHQSGLAVDIIDFDYPYLDSKQEDTPTQKWLMVHCAEYGFILRYPNGSSDITGIIYEPWHYRYVGVISARDIMERGITLEEYLAE